MSDTTYGSSPLARGLRHGRAGLVVEGRIIPARAGFTPPGRNRRKPAGDHPRSRGVYVGQHSLTVDRRRMIPARAGFTRPGHGRRPEHEDHPRSRGVYATRTRPPSRTGGSSPLARGLLAPVLSAVWTGRIIPARAGFTPAAATAKSRRADHPRSRGVYSAPPAGRGARPGSSPLARGLRRRRAQVVAQPGIIPARAGFTGLPPGSRRNLTDHPRSRGVYRIRRLPPDPPGGSSPLARGLLLGRRRRRAQVGIIPARAGFTPPRFPLAVFRADHPRSRGVYIKTAIFFVGIFGSSPLARGLRRRGAPARAGAGIIPARAGFTRMAPGARPCTRDHPRSRGVYRPRACGRAPGAGSSPLARGLRHGRGRRRAHRRIIPARAGFTPPPRAGGPTGTDHPRSRGVYTPKGPSS